MIRVFTDGSCVGNGTRDAVGGFGAWFEDPNIPSISKPMLPENSGGTVTNNRAELTAVLAALYVLSFSHHRTIQLYVDSEYVKLMLEKYCFADRGPPRDAKNLDLLDMIHELHAIKFLGEGRAVAVFHVPAHTNRMDPVSRGNQEADRLAAEGRNVALRAVRERGRVQQQANAFGQRMTYMLAKRRRR